MKKNSKFNMRLIIVTLLLVVVLTVVLISITSSSLAVLLDNGSRIEENSDLTYYIDVLYDGKDSQAVSSSDTVTAKIKSDYIYVEDRLPEGLTFKKFVTSNNGSIGAVKRSDNKTSCPGYVVGGTEGLVYNQDTNTVSFKVNGLQAGCKLTVGVITTTPTLNNKERIDFYNTAFARENNFSAQSNTVHVFMGRENANSYKVIYEYTGYVPQNSNVLPPVNSYTSGSIVAVANNPNISGYKFNGWSSQDVEIKD